MKRRLYLSLFVLALTVATAVAFVVGNRTSTGAGLTSSAAAALPASDFVLVVDVQRALSEALPTLLSNNPALLARFTGKLDEFEKKTGINPRVFESVAIGGDLRSPRSTNRADQGTVLIASGSFKSDELLNAGFAAAAKEAQFEKTEQQYEGRTIFVISSIRSLKKQSTDGNILPYDRFGDPRRAAKATVVLGTQKTDGGGATPNESRVAILTGSPVSDPQSSTRLVGSHPGTVAITVLGPNMIAVGSLESVRAAIDASLGRNRIDDELVRLALQSPNSIVGFSGRIPPSETEKAAAQNGNPFANYFASIREFYGSFGLNGPDTESVIAARTENAEQAHDISQAINSLKGLASIGIGHSTGSDANSRDAIAAVLRGLTINTSGNEIRIELRLPHATLAPLIRLK